MGAARGSPAPNCVPPPPPPPSRDRGIPGFSDNERERFSQLLTSAGLVDAWRSLNPAPAQTGAPPPLRTSASFTWRGTLRKEGNSKAAKYEGKVRAITSRSKTPPPHLLLFALHSFVPIPSPSQGRSGRKTALRLPP